MAWVVFETAMTIGVRATAPLSYGTERVRDCLGIPTQNFKMTTNFLRKGNRLPPWRVVIYKALSRTTTPRKRLGKTRKAPAGKPGVQLTVEETRTLLARELHDSVAQTLSAMLLDLDTFRAEQQGRISVLRQVDELEQSTRQALADLRELLVELRAPRLGLEDLVKLVRHGMLEKHGRRRGIEYELTVAPEWPELIPVYPATELNRIVQEAIENGVRHSGAHKIVVNLCLGAGGHSAVVTIIDDGRGLPAQDANSLSPGLGILGMRERASLLGGEVALESGLDGSGTTVRVTVPLGTVLWPGSDA